MDFKYKIADVAKEFGMPAKKVVETVSGVTGETYKTAGTFEEKELNVLLETLTRENAEDSLDAYLASGKEPYTSHNTNRLDVEGTVKKILTTEYVQNELKGIPNV